MAELNAGDEAFAEAVAEGTPPTESEAPAAEAAVAEVASAEPAGDMAEETSDPAADVPASHIDAARQANGVAAPTVTHIIRRVGELGPQQETAEAGRPPSLAQTATAPAAPTLAPPPPRTNQPH